MPDYNPPVRPPIEDELPPPPPPERLSPEQRTAIYAAIAPVGQVLGVYGLVTDTEWAAWGGLGSAVLAIAVAFLNRPTRSA